MEKKEKEDHVVVEVRDESHVPPPSLFEGEKNRNGNTEDDNKQYSSSSIKRVKKKETEDKNNNNNKDGMTDSGRKRLTAAAERRGLYVWDEENEKRGKWELPGKEFRKYYMRESDMEG